MQIKERSSNPKFINSYGKEQTAYGRFYITDDGLWMPSVTTVISPATGWSPKEEDCFSARAEKLGIQKGKTGVGKTMTEKRDAAGVKGTAIHKYCEQIDLKQPVNLDELDAPIREAVQAYIDNKPSEKVDDTELFVFSPTYGFAGTLDTLYAGPLIEDKKTGYKVGVEAGWQMAAYALGSREREVIPNEWDCALRVQHIRNGTCKAFNYQFYDWLITSFLASYRVWKAKCFNIFLHELHKVGKYPWLFQLEQVHYVNANRERFDRYSL